MRQRSAGNAIHAGFRDQTDGLQGDTSRSFQFGSMTVGCGGRLVDDATWTVTEITKPSLWGHRSLG